ncbi:MAG: PadR family transcriptional regulator [Firmicutes bacterium]|jgi:DNA-binding PadR family transcriptional regulator|nr:PadR family transcriptional regulator [Bacillota bacterium]
MNKEIMKGSIDILILSLIAQRDTYGYDIAKTIKSKSNDLYKMGEGTLYSALKRLENKSYIKSYWGSSEEGSRRKYYKITDDGQKALDKKYLEWKEINTLVDVCYQGVKI